VELVARHDNWGLQGALDSAGCSWPAALLGRMAKI